MNIYTFIAVNYNNNKFTKEYIESINKINIKKEEKIQIVIVDNDSSEDNKINLKYIVNKYENVKLIMSNKNLGYFGGLNLGIEETIKVIKTNVIIGNNDLTFDDKFIENLKKIKYEKNVMVIAPNIITKDGRMQNPHVVDTVTDIEKIKTRIYFSNYYIAQLLRTVNKMLKSIIKSKDKKINEYPRMNIKRGIGACYVLTENFFEFYEKLDDRVFLWGEEALLSNQVEKVNGKTLYDPTIIINHHESATVKCIQSKEKYDMVKKSYSIYRKYL